MNPDQYKIYCILEITLLTFFLCLGLANPVDFFAELDEKTKMANLGNDVSVIRDFVMIDLFMMIASCRTSNFQEDVKYKNRMNIVT